MKGDTYYDIIFKIPSWKPRNRIEKNEIKKLCEEKKYAKSQTNGSRR
jgi:hypothetical protein